MRRKLLLEELEPRCLPTGLWVPWSNPALGQSGWVQDREFWGNQPGHLVEQFHYQPVDGGMRIYGVDSATGQAVPGDSWILQTPRPVPPEPPTPAPAVPADPPTYVDAGSVGLVPGGPFGQDNSPPLQAWINTAPFGSILVFAIGDYHFGSTVDFSSRPDVHFEGAPGGHAGTFLEGNVAGPLFSYLSQSRPIDVTFRNVAFSNPNDSGGIDVSLDYVGSAEFLNCQFSGHGGIQIGNYAPPPPGPPALPAWQITVQDCSFIGDGSSDGFGAEIRAAQGVIEDCSAIRENGIAFAVGNSVSLRDDHVEQSGIAYLIGWHTSNSGDYSNDTAEADTIGMQFQHASKGTIENFSALGDDPRCTTGLDIENGGLLSVTSTTLGGSWSDTGIRINAGSWMVFSLVRSPSWAIVGDRTNLVLELTNAPS
jgi:hypothetical protein